MQPIYFLPYRRLADVFARERVKREELAAHGLDEVLADVGTLGVDLEAGDVIGAGPGGSAGLLLSALPMRERDAEPLMLRPETQDWQPVHDGKRLWIGLDKRSPPTPEDLERKKTIRGYMLSCEAGELKLPVVRRPDGTTGLPRRLTIDVGCVVERIKSQYEPLWNDLEPVCDSFLAGGELDVRTWLALSIRVLAINYRYDVALHNRLGWIDTENYAAILGAALDWPAVERATAKKNVSPPEISNTSPGGPEGSTGSLPVGASSPCSV